MKVTYYYCLFCENEYEASRQVKGLKREGERLRFVEAGEADDSHLCNKCFERLKAAFEEGQ